MLNIVFFEPEIPYNTGAIARTCALTNTRLHLIKPLGFDINEKAVKRAGLDYWPLVDLNVYENFEEFLEINPKITLYCATTKGQKLYCDVQFKDEDFIMFGRETAGLPKEIMKKYHDYLITIPMIPELKRSLNLANSANIILYEALRQLNFPFYK
ncbi:MAG: tRNA (cytidine(34)-2'-O)-methyltransferase [Ezakiella sp.]|nr:tRNA (cytidine(34)-2'-O)-methyltransferase [Ezakiella sp.]MDD7472050.1 tRNA (cytidine(34)-2'-O)-methyltransferase [Bacillota bacterium]MDY3924014.1 tRNA (cytidine(34)-2'-O)-methyltransferase [Ezakiella sp.]